MNQEHAQNHPETVRCPNCHTEHVLANASGPCLKTLDPFLALLVAIAPLFFVLIETLLFIILSRVLSDAIPVGLLVVAIILTVILTIPLMAQFVVDYQKTMLEDYVGVKLYYFTCPCHNEFHIIRPIERNPIEAQPTQTAEVPE